VSSANCPCRVPVRRNFGARCHGWRDDRRTGRDDGQPRLQRDPTGASTGSDQHLPSRAARERFLARGSLRAQVESHGAQPRDAETVRETRGKDSSVPPVLLSASGKVELHLDPTIVAETAFVLTSFYKQDRAEVADALGDLITGCRLKVPSEPVMLDALERFKSHPVDFPDAWVAAIAAHQGVAVASFDRDFDRFKDAKRFQPSGA